MPMIGLKCAKWHQPAGTTGGLDDPSLLTKCCPEFVKQLEILLGVDCHRLLVVILKQEWSNDACLERAVDMT